MSDAKSGNEDEAYKRYLLKKNLEVLKNKTGFHTALISLFVPPSRKISDAIGYLKNEINESSNIKSKANRNNVLDSITALIQRLKLYKEPPPTGLIMYAGQIPVNNAPGTEHSELYVIEPPEPINTFKYYCASQFLLDPLYDMIKEKGTWGFINIENKEAAIAWLKGSHLELTFTGSSGIHSKFHAGGQSQKRFERLIEEGAQAFYVRVGEHANETFLPITDLQGIFVSGGGLAKNKFVEKDVLDYRLKEKVLDLVDVGYSGIEGIRETIIKVQDKIKGVELIKEKQVFTRFFNEVVRETGKAVYGEKDVRRALNMGAVDVLLLSERIQKKRMFMECPICHYQDEKTISLSDEESFRNQIKAAPCPQCKSQQYAVREDKDLIEDLGENAEKQGTRVQMLSKETEEGETLFSTYGGIAGILRFQLPDAS